MPGQSLRISVDDAARYLSQVYENDFEVSLIKTSTMITINL